MEEIEITTEYIKADAFLKFAGVCATGGQAKWMIEEAQVSVNGEVCTQRGKKLYRSDIVSIVGGPTFRIV
ncbi:RNA-binding S4 domain-containing protein [Butyricicoccus sp.]|uniref:RNA-binding S4 domain-containing protein n=1 Tax=Butyricicoccus sp. TaxID=2049021 RepID=UPI0037357150